jgi:glycyl-tRNA synthetase
MTTMRRKLPFGIAQVGKSFRNEITPGNFTFRTREFEQMELEYFCKPGGKCASGERTDMEWWEHWKQERYNWYVRYGIRPEKLRLREHASDELAHYAKGCVDVEYEFPIGWSELEGIANRTDYDLKQHMEYSKKDLRYFDQERNEHYIPYVIEPSAGADRGTLAFLCDAYREEAVEGKESRKVLSLHYHLAPIKCAVFPLLRNRPELVEKARNLVRDMKPHFYTVYDDTAAIGKLYRRQDEIGTPFCVTVDVDTLTDGQVTLRNRDSMQQIRIPIEKVQAEIDSALKAAGK